MATISSLGIGSQLDANGIITQLVALEKQPLQVLQAKAATVQARISAFGQIKAQFSALNDVVSRIAASSAWVSRSASSSNTSAATITATTSAAPTSFTLDVDQLAQAQSVSSATIAAGAAVGAGTLTLRQGSWDAAGTTFTPATGKSDVAITITASDTVSTVAAKINSANAGVTATAFNDGTNDRLLIKSSATGVSGGFRIQVTDDDGTDTDDAGLSRLAFDPATLNPATSAPYGMAAAGLPVQSGQDAKARINGLTVTSSTNTLTGNIPGVTVSLLATTTTGYGTPGEVKNSVTMNVRNDTSTAIKNVQSFVDAYNAVAQSLTDLTKYDATTKTAAPFQGDAVVVGLQSILRNMVGSINGGGGAYQRLSDIGVAMQRDGTLAINSAKLGAAANNGTALQDLFTADNANPLLDGFAVKFAAFTKGALATSGMITNASKALDTELLTNGKEQDRVNQRAAATEARLRKQYSALDARMGQLTALGNYVNQQVTIWNKASGG